jgi:heat-inducible transcriptional repressor
VFHSERSGGKDQDRHTPLPDRLALRCVPGHFRGMVKPLDPFHDQTKVNKHNLATLNDRSRDIFRRIVDSYLTSGEAIGSRHVARLLPTPLSPASVRNVMQDLEELGLIYAPHTSAGRLPTELGLRFFVDAMLEIGDIGQGEREQIEAQVRASSLEQTLEGVLGDAMIMLSELTRGAGIVVTSKENARLKHMEFVRIEPERALAVLVADDGSVENRILPIPASLPSSALIEASNYLNSRLRGRTLQEVKAEIEASRNAAEAELGELTARLVDAGLASWAECTGHGPQLIVRGQANLLQNLTALDDLERIRLLFADLETKKDVIDLLSRAEGGEGVRIFIGSENKLFSLSGSAMIAAPFHDSQSRIVGVLGVIGPTRLNYARIVPMVDYTSRVVGRLLQGL